MAQLGKSEAPTSHAEMEPTPSAVMDGWGMPN